MPSKYGTPYVKCADVRGDYAVPLGIDVIFADASNGSLTITLYTPARHYAEQGEVCGKVRVLKTDNTANTVTITTASGSIVGLPTVLTTQNQGACFESDGMSKWFLFGGAVPLPQELDTDASPEFAGLTLGDEPVCATYIKRVATQFNTTAQSAINITGLSAPVEAAGVYAFRAVLHVTNNTGINSVFAIGGTSTATSFVAQASGIDNDASAVAGSRITSRGSSFSLPSALDCVVIEGLVVVNAAGTLTVQCALAGSPESGQLSVLVNSKFEVQRV